MTEQTPNGQGRYGNRVPASVALGGEVIEFVTHVKKRPVPL